VEHHLVTGAEWGVVKDRPMQSLPLMAHTPTDPSALPVANSTGPSLEAGVTGDDVTHRTPRLWPGKDARGAEREMGARVVPSTACPPVEQKQVGRGKVHGRGHGVGSRVRTTNAKNGRADGVGCNSQQTGAGPWLQKKKNSRALGSQTCLSRPRWSSQAPRWKWPCRHRTPRSRTPPCPRRWTAPRRVG
jgi:hypothetical protein